MSCEIVFENSDFFAINKPPGWSVHNPQPQEPCVLDLFPGVHLLNRLDKETSGLVLLTKNKNNVAPLTEALAAEQSQKIYWALLRGSWGEEKTTTTWNKPLTDKAEGRKNPQGLAKDRLPCLTSVEVLASNKYLTAVNCRLGSGRQHQIRKHAALARHPIVGDSRYNDPTYNQKMAAIYKTSRMFLHARFLDFNFKGQGFQIEAPADEEFKKVFDSLLLP